MSFFREMDLYKAVILVSLLLLPVTGWWIRRNTQEIADADKAIADATRVGGVLERIGKLQNDITVIQQNNVASGGQIDNPNVYFEGQIFRSVKSGLPKDSFTLKPSREEKSAGGGSDKQRVAEYAMKIDFAKQGGKDFEVSREVLQAILFNCESGASGQQGGPAQSIWKLQALSIQNATAANVLSSHKTPPIELDDRWIVKGMEFMRREPLKVVK